MPQSASYVAQHCPALYASVGEVTYGRPGGGGGTRDPAEGGGGGGGGLVARREHNDRVCVRNRVSFIIIVLSR
jgi:hypothetical protein